jgi:hypothetical protein
MDQPTQELHIGTCPLPGTAVALRTASAIAWTRWSQLAAPFGPRDECFRLTTPDRLAMPLATSGWRERAQVTAAAGDRHSFERANPSVSPAPTAMGRLAWATRPLSVWPRAMVSAIGETFAAA